MRSGQQRPQKDASAALPVHAALQAFSEDGTVVWESKDILLELERRFPHAEPLLPAGDEERQQVRRAVHWQYTRSCAPCACHHHDKSPTQARAHKAFAPALTHAQTHTQTQALDFIAELEEAGLDKAGYAFMTGGRMLGRGSSEDAPPPDLPALEAAFLKALDWFESALARHGGGPYLLGAAFSLADIMAISTMERLAAGASAAALV